MTESATSDSHTGHVFLSYASPDVSVAQEVCAAIEAAGRHCWIAPRDVRAGESYAAAIVDAINDCAMLVLLLSRNSADSMHVLREVERASSKKRQVLTVRLDDVALPRELEYFLSMNQWLDASRGGVDAILPELVAAVRGTHAGRHAESGAGATVPHATPQPSATPRPDVAARSGTNRTVIVVVAAVVALGAAYVAAQRLWPAGAGGAAARSISASVAAPTPGAAQAIAVLPFVDLSEKKDQEFFSDGLAEELLNELSRVPGLGVIGRTSSFAFKGRNEDIPTIGRKLNAAHVLEGSVRKSGVRLRVTAQLVRTDNGQSIWSQTFDRQLEDVFQVQDDIAGAVVDALKLKLAPGPQQAARRTSNMEAYSQFLIGRQLYEELTPKSVRAAAAAFRRAIDLDPKFGAAHAGLAMSLYNLSKPHAEAGTGDTQELQEALATAERGVTLSPDDASTYAVRGYLRFVIGWDWRASLADFDRSLKISAADHVTLRRYSTVLGAIDRMSEAAAIATRAADLDPLSRATWSIKGLYTGMNGQFDTAIQALNRSLEISPDSVGAIQYLGAVYQKNRRYADARAAYSRLGDGPTRLAGVACAAALLGDVAEFTRALESLKSRYAQEDPYFVGRTYACRGDLDSAFSWFDKAFELRDDWLVRMLKYDVALDAMRANPRYAALLRRMDWPP